jgi:hypothetical protein
MMAFYGVCPHQNSEGFCPVPSRILRHFWYSLVALPFLLLEHRLVEWIDRKIEDYGGETLRMISKGLLWVSSSPLGITGIIVILLLAVHAYFTSPDSSENPLTIAAGVNISNLRFTSSRHYLSAPLRRTARASPSSCCRVSISALSSAIVRAGGRRWLGRKSALRRFRPRCPAPPPDLRHLLHRAPAYRS